jgi:hypothetical protein
MAEAYKKLAQTLVDATVEAVYTVPANTQAIVKHIVITNETGSTATVTLYHDGTANVNIILPTSDIVAGGFAEFEGTITMEAGDTLQAKSGTDDVLGMTVHGMEIS